MPERLEAYPWSCFRQQKKAHPLVSFHRHNEAELSLLRSGRLVYQMNGETVAVPCGRLCLFWGGIPHRWFDWSEALDFQVICLPMAFVTGMRLPSSFLNRLLQGHLLTEKDRHEVVLDEILMARWERDLRQTREPVRAIARLEIEARVRRLALGATHASRSFSCGSDALSRLLAVLTRSATDGGQLKELASQAGLHPKYAMRLFKRECGISLLAYLHQLRISHAQRLLVTTDHKITDVAFACGFSSSAQFFDVFKRLTGRSPNRHRQMIQAEGTGSFFPALGKAGAGHRI